LVDGKDGVGNVRRELLSKRRVEFCSERCSGDRKEKFSVNLLRELEVVEELSRTLLAMRFQWRRMTDY
jgi:hypothetical protein